MMNLLAFDNVKQYKEVLNDTSFVKCKLNKWPTVANNTMIKHAYNKWQPDARFVILLNQYKSNIYSENILKFNGERLVIIDGGDKKIFWPPYIDMCSGTNHIYIKENSYSEEELNTAEKYKKWRKPDWPKAKGHPNANVRIGCYCPSMKVPFLLQKHDIEWKHERSNDVIFCGDMHKGRSKKIHEWRQWCKDNNKKYQFGNERSFRRPRYLHKMSKTKLAPSFLGYGSRCRREWEALLTGALLVNDPQIKGYPFVIMHPEKHFTFKKEWNSNIAYNGFSLARQCWMNSPSIDIRMTALYLFFGVEQMWTYEDVKKNEEKYGLKT